MLEEALGVRRPAPALARQPLVEMQLEHLAGDVEVDLGEHVVARQHQRLERVHAALVDADAPLQGGRIAQRRDGLEQPSEVVVAIADAAVEAVAQEVVHLVDVELAGDDLRQQSLDLGAASGEDALDAVGGRRRRPPRRSITASTSGVRSRRTVMSS